MRTAEVNRRSRGLQLQPLQARDQAGPRTGATSCASCSWIRAPAPSQHDREGVTRFVVGAFRIDAARAGAAAEVEPLVEALSRASPEFAAMWRDHDVRAHGEAIKHIRHPVLGPLAFEYSAFAVDGRPDLSLVVYNPAEAGDLERIAGLVGVEG